MGHAIVRVEDDGPGIPAAMREDVLKPFVRLDPTRGDGAEGVGLGLAVVQSVVTLHGGRLSFENRQPKGLSVVVALPFTAPDG